MSDDFFYHVQKAYLALKSAEAGPSDADLAQATLMELWLPARNRYGALILWGQVVDHPELGADDITTSPFVSLDIPGRIARSCSRWYRLGQPLFRFAAELADQISGDDNLPVEILVEFPGVVPVEDVLTAQALITHFTDHVRQRAQDLGVGPGRSET